MSSRQPSRILQDGVFPHSSSGAEGAKPNIVIIVADDLGYADVLFNPAHPKEVTTPNLDALAKKSVICRQGYVRGHVCRAAPPQSSPLFLQSAPKTYWGER